MNAPEAGLKPTDQDLSSEDKKAIAKEKNKLREIAAINSAIASGTYTTKRDRVAGILNMYPDCRDSDMVLTVRYWETFQGDIYGKDSLTPRLLFKLERLTTIARLRAKIQNDYGLFLGTQKTRNQRRQKEEEVRTEIINDSAPPKIIQIFADESGKTGEVVIIGSVWFLNVAKGTQFQIKYQTFKERIGYKGEFHFSEVKNQTLNAYKQFVDFSVGHRDYVSFKVIATKRKGNSRSIDEVITKLSFLLLVKGYAQELQAGRFIGERRLIFVVDESGGPDSIGREDLKIAVTRALNEQHGSGAVLSNVEEIDSKQSAAIQLADLISGALNRKMNYPAGNSPKDDLANYIVDTLGLKLDESVVEDDAFRLITF